jgi:hypothetical protein
MREDRYLIPRSNFIFIFGMMVFSFLYFFIVPRFVPYYFIQDSGAVRKAMVQPEEFDQAYRNTAMFYKFLGFNYNSSKGVVYLFAWLIVFLWLLTLLRINKKKLFSAVQKSFVIVVVLLYGIEFTALTKDLLLILFMIMIVNMYISNQNMLFFTIGATIYAFFFRSYWFLVAVWSFYLSFKKKPKVLKEVCTLLFFCITVICMFNIFKHGQITNARAFVNVYRDTSEAHSMLNNILTNTNFLTDFVNWLYTLLTLIVPLQGISSANMIVYYTWIWILLFFFLMNRNQINTRVLLLLIGYLAIQALFEPDVGSTFRHQLPWCPFLYLFLDLNDSKQCTSNVFK